MARYAFFLGCNIPARVSQYERSARRVLQALGQELVDVRQFNCCGYPLRNSDPKAFLLSAARNLALAEQAGLDLLVLCQCCYGSLKKAEHLMAAGTDLPDEVRGLLRADGLAYSGTVKIKHLLSVLYHDVGLEAIRPRISNPFKELKIAAQYGCHGLRPSSVTQLDDPVHPTMFEKLVDVTGARSVDWPLRLECCGAPQTGINDELSKNLTRKKLADGRRAGAQYVCTVCPYCHIQFDAVQQTIVEEKGNGSADMLPAILYPQLLGLGMGIDGRELGIGSNRLDIGNIVSFLSEESKNG